MIISVVPRLEDVLAPTDGEEEEDDDDDVGVVLCCDLSLALILILLIDFITGDTRPR